MVDLDQTLLDMMDRWPDVWARIDEDVPVGQGFVAEMRPFIQYLHEAGLSPKTVRRHLDNCWVIGGEIIRQFNLEPELRKMKPLQILLDAIAIGEAPLVKHADDREQLEYDATARKLLRFLKSKSGGNGTE